jgi:competence protein ComEC
VLISYGKKYPALFTVLPLMAGIIISYFSGINLSVFSGWFFVTILLVFAAFIIAVYKMFPKGELYLIIYIFLVALFGLFSFQYRFYKTEASNISFYTGVNKSSKITLKAIVSEPPEVTDERVRILLDVIAADNSSCTGVVFATVYKNKFSDDRLERLTYGDVVELKGKLESLPGERNPGEFDYGKYLKMHGIDAVFTAFGYENISITGREEPNIFRAKVIYPVKEYSIKVIDSLVGGSEGEYLKGLLVGERSNIPRQVKENFINAGVAHIIAVSGLNVAYVIFIIWVILLFVPIKHVYKIFITIACLLFYMELTGNTPSIIRAVIMASIFLISQIAERRPNSYNIVSFAALVILVIDPRQLFDAGFILSFSAILSFTRF